MKKKIISLILIAVLILASVIGIGCSKASCTYTTCSKCGSCHAENCEKCGKMVDCSDFLCNAIMGEVCHDRCRVSCWYTCAETWRTGGTGDSTSTGCLRCWNCYKDDLRDLEFLYLGYYPGDYYQVQDVWNVEFEREPIKNLTNYFYLTVTFTFTLPSDVKDLFIVFDMKEVLDGYRSYNYVKDALLFITEEGKKGETFTVSATFTMSTDGEAERYNSEYIVKVHKYYGRVD